MLSTAVEGEGRSPARKQQHIRDLLSVVVVTSPAPCNPSTDLLHAAVSSIFQYVRGMDGEGDEDGGCDVHIVCDGYRLCGTECARGGGINGADPRPKRGLVTADMAATYEQYIDALHVRYAAHAATARAATSSSSCEETDAPALPGAGRVYIHRMEEHCGFAMAARAGLLRCGTPYCLVAQHDRAFMHPFTDLWSVLAALGHGSDAAPSNNRVFARYVGFPTIFSCSHEAALKSRYQMDSLTRVPKQQRRTLRVPLATVDSGAGDSVGVRTAAVLQPLIFWYDSQHLCNVARYLEIYAPFTNLPPLIKSHLGSSKRIASMLLRGGDFIEDRFGQAQRNLLADMAAEAGRAWAKVEDARAGEGTVLREEDSVTPAKSGSANVDSNATAVTDAAVAASERLEAAFQWFGSYLYTVDQGQELAQEQRESPLESSPGADDAPHVTEEPLNAPQPARHLYPPAVVMVMHMRGRQNDAEKVQQLLDKVQATSQKRG